MKEAELLEVQKTLIENLFDSALPQLGFEVDGAAIDDRVFKSSTSIMYKLYTNGTLDTAECGDFYELAIIAQAIPRIADYLINNPVSNVHERELSPLSDLAKNMQVYLALYEGDSISIAEDILPSEGPKDLSLIAAALKIQPTTLRNIISSSELNAFTIDELKAWLEKQDRFIPYKKMSSVALKEPFDFSLIRSVEQMLHTLKFRCDLMGKLSVWNEFEEKHLPNGLDSANALFSKMTFRMERLYKVFAAANLKPESIEAGLKNAKKRFISDVNSAFSIVEMNYGYHLKEAVQGSPHQSINSKELKELLTSKFDFTAHPSDRERNKKMSGMLQGNFSLAIENLKTPQVWVNERRVNVDMLENLTVSHYDETSDGKGRHSGLGLYKELAKERVLKIKIDSIDSLNQLMKAVKTANSNVNLGD
ncbi:MAG: hypothetical protein ACI9O6_000906 [Glaciecola sp.]|jgi:hypothetical protein